MTSRRFMQLDVFASGPFTGNPLAVVLDGEGLSTAEMQQITDWTNLSEATFLSAPTHPEADYRVRIFCPGRELPFAGHPTLGSCQAWLSGGGVPMSTGRIVQECGAGLIAIRRDGDRLAFAAPPMIRTGPVDPALLERRIRLIGLDESDVVASAWIDNGPGWMGILLESADAVLDVDVPHASEPGFDVGLVGLRGPESDCAIEVRAFFADGSGSIREDPVTGSLNASVAQWLTETGRVEAPYVAAQGQQLGRRGRVYVEADDGELWIGGRSTVSITGTLST
ncbi:PhzF family phenazine biosynthesis protein [Ilumatobacter nonamiensis]|uniref:PhzF family phenazine biosynthesis protein n=1 Tax=Ilumatobacter nonamiensis TaxID=467093 RepID=UPI000590CA46|nr:PhzF family phenazine biosynthesis protein [Ilumatobacter nonamiensis]